MKTKIKYLKFQRNGVGGEPFTIALQILPTINAGKCCLLSKLKKMTKK